MYRCIKLLLAALLVVLSAAPVPAADTVAQLTLDQAIVIALDQNPEFKKSTFGTEGAEHRRKAAGADFLPKIGTSYSYTRNAPPHLKLPADVLSPQKINIVTGTENVCQWDLYLVQPLFMGGEIYNKYQLEKLGVDVARLKNEMVQNDLIYGVKAAYFNILKNQRLENVARQSVEQIASHEKTARDFYEQEMTAKNDLLEAQVRLAQAEQDLVHADQSVGLAKAEFNTVLHQDVNTNVNIAEMSDVKELSLTLDESLALAIDRQPVIREIDATIKQAQTEVKLAQGTYFPKVYLQSSYNRQGNQADVNGSPYLVPESWNVSVNIDFTFWEWGKKGHVVGEQKVKLLEAQETRKAAVDKVMLQVKDAWLKCEEYWKNIKVARSAIAHAEENFRIYQNRFSEQMATTTDVLDAQTLLTTARKNYNNAIYDYLTSCSELEWAMAMPLAQ